MMSDQDKEVSKIAKEAVENMEVYYRNGIKKKGAFYPGRLIKQAQSNAKKYLWAAKIQKETIKEAEPWLKMSDEELWSLMFGNTISRVRYVSCPSCKKGIWVRGLDPFEHPWKVRCRSCKELFPKNDFYKFYKSGFNKKGIFDPKLADRSLLFNVEHPDPKDPLYKFGVDDGEGFIYENNHYHFIGTYLPWSQWRYMIVTGIARLSAAYMVTGNPEYAHKAGVLFDRVADLYPTFDFKKQAPANEENPDGYISFWGTSCTEIFRLALAYDQVFEALSKDKKLVTFLSQKAKKLNLENKKETFDDIQRNIENRILRDTIKHRHKIINNYPGQDIAIATIKTVLEWPENREEIERLLGEIITRSTAVDGVTGEKGMAGYVKLGPMWITSIFGQYIKANKEFVKDFIKRYPSLYKMWRFDLDIWCLEKYYPNIGDASPFAWQDKWSITRQQFPQRVLISEPSVYSLFRELYKITGNEFFLQALYKENNNSVKDMPGDIFASDPAGFQKEVSGVIAKSGEDIQIGSINKKQWHLAILRSGKGNDKRALWIDYDSGGRHGHNDGMNIGLFARGLNLIVDFGMVRGKKVSPKAYWYKIPAAHNTVVIDGQDQRGLWHNIVAGKTTLWADGKEFRTIRVSGPEIPKIKQLVKTKQLVKAEQYERTLSMIDISSRDFYILDIFRVVGGKDHAKFQNSYYGDITTQKLIFKPTADYGHGTIMRNTKVDKTPLPAWSVDYKIEDRYKYLPPGTEAHLRYTDLTAKAQVYMSEGWVARESKNRSWIPCVMVRRQSKKSPLSSTFVSVIEPYEKKSNITGIRRLALKTDKGKEYPDSNVAVEVTLADGRRDIIIAANVENPLGLKLAVTDGKVMIQPESGLKFIGEMCMVRFSKKGNVEKIVLCNGRSLSVKNINLRLKSRTDFIEIDFHKKQFSVISGKSGGIEKIIFGDSK
jgi:hypothetical protein